MKNKYCSDILSTTIENCSVKNLTNRKSYGDATSENRCRRIFSIDFQNNILILNISFIYYDSFGRRVDRKYEMTT